MRITKKLATVGAGTGLFAASLMALPFGGTASAASAAPAAFGSNSAIEVQTDVNCTSHTLTANIKNKTTGDITPDVTFNKMPPAFDEMAIKPGMTGMVTHDFSGNNMPVDVSVAVDGQQPVNVKEMLRCDEPISFLVTNASESGVGGFLTNNSPFVAQTVIAQAGTGAQHLITLGVNETRYVPLTGEGGLEAIFVEIGNTTGWSSSYNVNFAQVNLPPLPPAPEPKDEV